MNTPHWPARTLKEVISFLSRQHPGGMRVVSVSEKVGITPQAISSTLKKDDASLSWVEGIASKYGFCLRLEYTIPECLSSHGGLQAFEVHPNAGSLMGLAIYAVSRGWSINAFARYVGINYRVIERAFKTGDIKITTLKEILEKLNIQVEWIWRQER